MIDFIKDLKDVDDKAVRLAADEIYQSLLENQNQCKLNLKIGVLEIKLIENELQFKFKPSTILEQKLQSKLSENRNLLIKQLETSVVSKFLTPMEELL